MAPDNSPLTAADDAFFELAPYYDAIMDHVNYERWFNITTSLAQLLPPGFAHLDAACGTGKLLKRLHDNGWRSLGVDLSFAMIRAGRKDQWGLPAAVADLRAVPIRGGAHYATCLFDSINFLLETRDLKRAFREIADALAPPAVFYFDIVTERMVTLHFEGQEWTEDNGRFSTAWHSTYSRKTHVAETHVRVNTGPAGTVRERVYTQAEIEHALREAGFALLGAFDARSWKSPGKRTTRIDFVAAKDASRPFKRRFDAVAADIRRGLA